MDTGTSSQSSFVYQVNSKDLISIALDDPQRTFFPGEQITGAVQVGLQFQPSASRIAVHLCCKARLGGQGQRRLALFKVTLEPTHVAPGNSNNRFPFTITIPYDVPSSVDHETVPGKIEYKLKAVHEILDLPGCVWPKTSIPILVHEAISAAEEKYKKTLQSEGKLTFHAPHDIFLKNYSFRKGDIRIASALLSIPRSCFLPAERIPFTLHVHHFAPTKQMDGATAYLERITQVVTENEGKTMDIQIVDKVVFPLACDDDRFESKSTFDKLAIPADAPPSLEKDQFPLQIMYRIRVAVNLDMDALPLRKRDRVASYVNRRMRSLDEEQAGVISLDIPITVGTTQRDRSPSPQQSKSLFDGGYGFFQQSENGYPFSPVLGPPPPAYSASSTNTVVSTPVVMRKLTHTPPIVDSISSSSSSITGMSTGAGTSTAGTSASRMLLLPMEHPMGIIRQPSAPSLQDLEKQPSPPPLPYSDRNMITSPSSYSEANMPADNGYRIPNHIRSWSVPTEYPYSDPLPPSASFTYQHHYAQQPRPLPSTLSSEPRCPSGSAPPLATAFGKFAIGTSPPAVPSHQEHFPY